MDLWKKIEYKERRHLLLTAKGEKVFAKSSSEHEGRVRK